MFPSLRPIAAAVLLLAFLAGGIFADFALAAPAAAQSLPGLPSQGEGAPAARDEAPGWWQKTRFQIARWQQGLQRDLAGIVRELKEGRSWAPLATLLFFSFLYGVVHAAGPGHGKVVISSYLLAQESQIRRGVQLSFLASLVQAVSAIVLVGVLALVLDLTRRQAAEKVQLLEIASYSMIILLGLWMLVAALRGKIGCGHDHHHHGGEHDDGHAHEGGQGCGHGHLQPPPVRETTSVLGKARGLAAIVLSVGIRPCSGAVIILLFTLAQGIFLAGVLSTFAMALGTGITVAVLGILAVSSRNLAVRLAGHDHAWEERIGRGLAIVGSLAICVFGVLFLFLTLNQPISMI